ncbi:strawberry notch C-terminal domain-containing protein [Paracoccus litorisediminis]|uniref:strawberry notch C-terminal domain-containing protein n=1 Tax=Paracoccus litorisediminis TaxID=2006130 RepID=UPI003735342A
MRLNAAARGRGFLLADATGVGKGRSLAAMALAHIRSGENKKVLYFTESGAINAPDVYRDLKDVGAVPHINPMFLTTGSSVIDTRIDPVTGLEYKTTLESPKAATRKNILASESWPEDVNVIITTYSQFRGKEDEPSTLWLEGALDADTLIILDEAHNALNEKSIQGKNIRKAIKAVCSEVGTSNIIDGTATPMRDPSGMSLYAPTMPFTAQEGFFDNLLKGIKEGGEVAQETFATMLAEDGVLLRRDHDLSNIEFNVALPDDERMLRYQNIINKFAPVVEMMIECSGRISEHLGRRQAADYQAARAAGMSEEAARAHTNEMNQYSVALGSPLANLARITMNAVKIDQVVDETLQEIQEGRKPMITFHSTNGTLLDERSLDANGAVSEDAMANARGLTLKDQVRRIHQSMYRIKLNDEKVDARDEYPNVAEASHLIEELIDQLPDDLPVSPIDALIEKLEIHGVSVGELSGRTKAYRGNRIVRLTPEQRDKRGNIDAYNNGDLDVLIYNSAGATGGSFHASPKFKDQKPRTMIEMEAPTDVIKYVQGLGRGNRYGQVARPRIKSVVTGLTPEMRILQQRNKKLRSLGASVDGNRSHPMLLDDIPDLLNKVGDEATRNVLLSMPALSRRLGFAEFAEMEENNRGADTDIDAGSGSGGNAVDSLSNKVLARSLMLPASQQDDLVKRIVMEFDALIEELESRNANPLRPKELDGVVDIRATSIHSGMVVEEGDLDTSAFLSPLYISTAIHRFNEEAWNGDKLITEIERAKSLYGSEGFQPYAERIIQNLPSLMRPYLPEGLEMDRAMETPTYGGARFETRHGRFTDLAWLLENLRPGVGIRYPDPRDNDGMVIRTVVGLVPPTNPDHYDLPSGYKVKLILPGLSKPETISVSRLMSCNQQRIFFTPSLSETYDEHFIADFDREAIMTRALPVQILSGNLLSAISEASQHKLGTISLYRDMEGHVHRGIVVPKSEIDLEKLPVPVANGHIGRELAYRFLFDESVGDMGKKGKDGKDGKAMLRFWGSMDPAKPIPPLKNDAELYISVTRSTVIVDMLPLRKSTEEFYRSRPGLYEAIHGKPLPAPKDVPARALRRGNQTQHAVRFKLESDMARNRILRILDLIGPTNTLVDSPFRSVLNDIAMNVKEVMANPRIFGMLEDDVALALSQAAESDAENQQNVEEATQQEGETVGPAIQEEDIDIDQTNWGF